MIPNPTKIKLLVLDIDGTLVGTSNAISDRVKRSVQRVREQGIQVAIATGRMYKSAIAFHQDLDLTLPLIAYQGAWIQNPHEPEPLYHQRLSFQQTFALLDCLAQPEFAQGLCVHLYIADELYVQERGEHSGEYAQRSGVKLQAIQDWQAVLTAEPTKLLVLSSNAPLLQRVWQQFNDRFAQDLYLTRSTEAFVEATHPAVNKGAAVRFLAEQHLGLNPENVMTIGDNYNDLEMLEYAGIGIAMGTAPDPVKAIAQGIAPSVEEDGIAVVLEEWLGIAL